MSRYETIATLEELVALAVRHASSTYAGKVDTRYGLKSWHQETWADEAQGKDWEAKAKLVESAAEETYRIVNNIDVNSYCREAWVAGETARRAWVEENPRPKKRQWWEYTLDPEGKYGTKYTLGEDLGNKVYAVFKKRKTHWAGGHQEAAGQVSLATLLERLGKTDIGKELEAAHNKAVNSAERNKRNAARREARRAAEEFFKAFNKFETVLGVTPSELGSHSVAELMAVIGEEEVE